MGLAFEPVRDTDQPDIEGTLWLDRETAALQFLEFGYTWAEYQEARGVARGRVEFEGLPNGAWIVRKFWIRMPRLAQDLSRAREGRTGVYVAGIREAGRVQLVTAVLKLIPLIVVGIFGVALRISVANTPNARSS